MICSNCGFENDAGAKFCNECGSGLQAACPNCGATNKPGAKFCNECGTALAGTGAAQSLPRATTQASLAERRLVTVLFADLVGFTPFAEERDAEDVRDTLTRYFDLCSDIVKRYGGTIEKFIGDAVMAVWGAPVAHEDDAERAVRAALELVDAVRTLAPNAQARAGALTGEAAVTVGATNQGMVAGDLVNTAARLQSVAQPGTVLVGEATFRAASGAIHFEPAGEQLLKGKQSPVPAWRAVRVVAELGGRNRSEALEPPFVGRTDELRLLKDLFHATGREKKARLVSVMGPAGIGKSRLAWEFSKYTDGLVEDTYWHTGRAPAYGEGITFWALGEMIRRRCGLVEGDDEHTTREKVTETVTRWVLDTEEREWIERALLTLLGFESGMASEQLFGAWRTFFERIASGGTVAMVFEDMHHADSGLLDFIDHLLEWSRGLPIYIVTLARPELLERRPDWGAGKRSFTSIHLEPLSSDDMRELLAGLIPGLPEEASKRIIERSGGIPLYAVETVRMLISEGRLREEGGVYVPVGKLDTLAVPETLTALIASRLDSLEAADRSLMQDAAVLGQSFSVAALAALSALNESSLEDRLKGLVRRELLGRDLDPRSPERGQYAFVQALIREVAYNTLSRKDRKARHLAAARYFEVIGSEELASALANHYLSAFQNATEAVESDALAGQARLALRGAAERAASLGSHEQAIAFIEQALTVTRDPADEAELLERAGRSASQAARFDDSDSYLRRALQLHNKSGNRIASARVTAALGWTLLNARRNQAALDLLEQADREFSHLWPDPAVVELKTTLGRAFEQSENHKRSVEVLDEALNAAEHANLLPLIARSLAGKGAALGSLGRLREGQALIEAAEQLARDNDLHETLTIALVIGGFHLGEIDVQEAHKKYVEGLALSKRTGQRALMFTFVNNIGYTGFLTGNWESALAELEALLSEDVDRSHRMWLMGNALNVRASRGDDIAARLSELEELASPEDDADILISVLDARGNAALAAGQLQDARAAWRSIAEAAASQAPASFYQAARASLWAHDLEAARRDLADLDATGFHGPVVDVRRDTIKAGIMALEGKAGEALSLYRDCLVRWRELGMSWDQALTGLDAVTLLDPASEHVQAIARETHEIFERLSARPYLERLDASIRRASHLPTERRGAVTTAEKIGAAEAS